MSLGATTSAPASTCETAVRASSSSDASLSTSPSRSTPQWPCAVYSQRQTSVISSSSGKRGRSARSACWTIPSSIQAPEPSSSFSSGMPNRITALTPARTSSSHSRTTPSTVCRAQRGQALVRERLGRDEERHARGRRARPSSRARGRAARPVRRRRRSRVAGNVLIRAKRVRAPVERSTAARSAIGSARSTGSTSTGIRPPPGHGSSTIRSAKNSQVARPTASSGSAIRRPAARTTRRRRAGRRSRAAGAGAARSPSPSGRRRGPRPGGCRGRGARPRAPRTGGRRARRANGGIAPSHGPRYGSTSVSATHAAEEERVLLARGATAPSRRGSRCRRRRSTPMISEKASLPAHVRGERVLDAPEQRRSPRRGKRRSIARPSRCMSSSM